MVNTKNKPYASVEHETVQAIVHSLFRFPSSMQAQLFASRFADTVTVSLRRPDKKDRKSIMLWVEGYGLTGAERKQGALGNYAKITPVELSDGKWTLAMKKFEMPLAKHPLKAAPARKPLAGRKKTAMKKAAPKAKKKHAKK